MTRVFVPQDSVAQALGAAALARAIEDGARRRGLAAEIVRTGSRGLFWLEPMIEVETPAGRIAYGPVSAEDVGSLLDAGLLGGGAHALRLGRPEELPYLARQQRLTFSRCGITDPLSLDDYRATGGLRGLEAALAMGGAAVVAEVTASGLRGRGGAGFPTGIKWNTVRAAEADRKYVVCNADEGDSGTFADRMLMEGDPFTLIEGMVIAGLATGATKGYIYLRSEYPLAHRVLGAAIAVAEAAGLLGPSVLGSGQAFGLEVRLGAGAYICGEETAMLESLEGKRGIVRAKPPLPALRGLFGRPTLVNNMLSLAAVPWILAHGGAAYAECGMGRSRGTMPFQLAGNVRRGGLVELGFGLTLRELVEGFGGGTRSGRPVRAVQVGGPLGAYFPERMLDLPLDYEALAGARGMLGHGGVVVFDDTVDMARQARFAFEFCAAESCGKCTPCRIGAVRGVEVLDKVIAGQRPERNLALVKDLCEVMQDGSLCAMGGLTPLPVMSALMHFPEDFARGAAPPEQIAAGRTSPGSVNLSVEKPSSMVTLHGQRDHARSAE
ncbi:NADH-ubiquinone oxidoreductase-F iron-sulfur binding region domain-containing protein [Roseicella aquatilis]|uniref:Formate dehydrogenase n=1 Tax=Roseicella aquatilis TaxID=2527868 RepID=A0A4R4D6G2_9PROT|nr:NADH-ubiquinone oxidoreductase-F iron-sulfur binding region domain-containing protein [Roseicella aquatilis]TCZ55577.1 formate dehydrogenase [Roseicella aquatilis]